MCEGATDVYVTYLPTGVPSQSCKDLASSGRLASRTHLGLEGLFRIALFGLRVPTVRTPTLLLGRLTSQILLLRNASLFYTFVRATFLGHVLFVVVVYSYVKKIPQFEIS